MFKTDMRICVKNLSSLKPFKFIKNCAQFVLLFLIDFIIHVLKFKICASPIVKKGGVLQPFKIPCEDMTQKHGNQDRL